jgi:hypothetical protein
MPIIPNKHVVGEDLGSSIDKGTLQADLLNVKIDPASNSVSATIGAAGLKLDTPPGQTLVPAGTSQGQMLQWDTATSSYCAKTSSHLVVDMPGSQGLPGDLPTNLLAEEGLILILAKFSQCLQTKYPQADTLKEMLQAIETEICSQQVALDAATTSLANLQAAWDKYGRTDTWNGLPAGPQVMIPNIGNNIKMNPGSTNSLTTTDISFGYVTIVEAGWYEVYFRINFTHPTPYVVSIELSGAGLMDYVDSPGGLSVLAGNSHVYLSAGTVVGFQANPNQPITAPNVATAKLTYLRP